jgi:5'-nucleotidase
MTWKGHLIDLEIGLRPEQVDIEDVAHSLAQINRYCGHTHRPYPVATHSVIVATLVPPAHALAGLLHDGSEAYLGDVIRPLKRLLPGYGPREVGIMAAIRERFPHQASAIVSEFDNRIVAAEIREFMSGHSWWMRVADRYERQFGPAPEIVFPRWDSYDAEAAFLDAFTCIQGGRPLVLSKLGMADDSVGRWISAHPRELRKYAGRHVAIHPKLGIVASGSDVHEVTAIVGDLVEDVAAEIEFDIVPRA